MQLHQGKILQPAQQNLLIGFMQRATTGLHRLRGNLPSGTIVADKTGSGEKDAITRVAKVTNDVGIISHGSSNYVLSVFTEGIADAEVANQTIASVAQTVHAAWGPER